MKLFLALHRIAAQRGDGLHPALASLLERRDGAESACASPAPAERDERFAALPSLDLDDSKKSALTS